jgi:type I restriction enzyme R subunit
MNILTEDEIEQMALGIFSKDLQYDEILHGPDLLREFNEVVLKDKLQSAIERINPELNADLREEAFRMATRAISPSLNVNNENFHTYLTEGIDVKGTDSNGQVKTFKAWLIDFKKPCKQSFRCS